MMATATESDSQCITDVLGLLVLSTKLINEPFREKRYTLFIEKRPEYRCVQIANDESESIQKMQIHEFSRIVVFSLNCG
jgi:hypothetical protein